MFFFFSDSAQIASCLQDCSDTIQQKTSPKPSQVTCSAEESQQKSYSHPCTLEEEAVYVSQQNPSDTLSSKPSNPLGKRCIKKCEGIKSH
jgi:hypothetical protein